MKRIIGERIITRLRVIMKLNLSKDGGKSVPIFSNSAHSSQVAATSLFTDPMAPARPASSLTASKYRHMLTTPSW